MYQQVTLIGNLGSDPEMRYTNNGTAVTGFRMAVSRSWTGQDGNRVEKTVWFRVTAWNRGNGKLAEIANQYLTKGSKVLVVGEMEEPNAYLDKEGKPRASLEVTAHEIKFLSTKPAAHGEEEGEEAPARQAPPQRQAPAQARQAPSAPARAAAPAKAPAQQAPPPEKYDDDDIPF